jgi:hypothetical protein
MRTIIVGDNQFELYASLEAAASSMELPEVRSGLYRVFDEGGREFGFEILDSSDIPVGTFTLKLIKEDAMPELLRIYSSWVAENEIPNMPSAGEALFDELEEKWGLD